jgi:chitin disaccharide deacetylase
MTSPAAVLIVNADVTSATLLVRSVAATEAAAYARRRPGLSVGLHVDLAEWEYDADAWRPRYEVVDTADRDAVAAEVARQVAVFESLIGQPPTHLDSHQHVHRDEPVRSVLRQWGERLDVPVRDLAPTIRYNGAFYGQDGRGYPVPDAITVDALIDLIAGLPPGVTELGCHPGDPVDLDSVYRDERRTEVESLCNPRVRAAIEENGVQLRSFATVTLR